MIKLFLILLVAAVGAVLVLAALVWVFQHKLIYHPMPYRPTYPSSLPPGTAELSFRTSSGTQLAFYVPPPGTDPGAVPPRLWVLFGGNGSVALGWLSWVRQSPDPGAGFLLIDYPGYGGCEGEPSPHTMRANAEGAFRALAERLKVAPEDLEKDLRVAGHSLGAAAALDFAAGHPIRKAVLLAPFTTLRDMAHHVVGQPLATLLRHRFDNRERLQELAARPSPPSVFIYHGDRDQVIPVSMGRRLAAEFPELVRYTEVPGADHISILDVVDDILVPEEAPSNE